MDSKPQAHPSQVTDAGLVAAALSGDQAAFGEIVRRYQNLVCSLAYSGCGSLSRSEDIAQETFVAAWRGLAGLRDPDKIRPWLCGITRKLVANSVRNENRAGARTDSLEDASEVADGLASPSDIAAGRDEQALVWHALERIQPVYREPLILYYRQHQSVAEVASALELSEDAARQRLSRGRRLLREEVTSLIAKALERSRPGGTFTAAVLVTLPAAAPALAAAAVAGGGVAAAEGVAMGLPVAAHSTATGASVAAKSTALAGGGAALAGPALGMLGAWLGAWFSIRKARSARERNYLIRMTWLLTALVALFSAALLGLAIGGRTIAHEQPGFFAMLLGGSLLAYGLVIFALARRVERRQRQIQHEDGTETSPAEDGQSALELRRRRAARMGGIAGAAIAPAFLPVQAGDWVSVGAILVAGLFAYLLCERMARRHPDDWRRRAFFVPFAFLGICWLALLNLRFTTWFPQLDGRPGFLTWTWIWIPVLMALIAGEILLSRRRRAGGDAG